MLNKRSFRSLKKHKSVCILYKDWAKKNVVVRGKHGAAASARAIAATQASD